MPNDQGARDIIANETKLNLMVEAGAGSGKTEEMANRVVALVSTGYREISEIVAITFTRKAANELKERVRTKLEKEYNKPGNAPEKDALLKKALDNIHECFIGTIHSFCSKLLRERPIEAGIDPEFENIEEAQDTLTRQIIWETYVLKAGEEEKAILEQMDFFGVSESVAKDFLKTMCANQDVEFKLPGETKTTYEDIVSSIPTAVEKFAELVENHYKSIPAEIIDNPDDGDNLQKNIIDFRYKLRGRDAKNLPLEEQVRLLMLFFPKSSVDKTLKNWSDEQKVKDYVRDVIAAEFETARNATVTPVLQFIYNSVLLPFTTKAKEIYNKHKYTVAELNFQDLLICSSEMLRDNPSVRKYFQDKYKTLLIDEFQDTDPIQIEMSMYLVGKELDEKRWNKLTPIEGSLFVVGDPKQSIYSFRRADFEMYKRFCTRMEDTGGKPPVSLHSNFRAVDELGQWYNNVFAKLLPGGAQALFTHMDAEMPTESGTLAGVVKYKNNAEVAAGVIDEDVECLEKIINHIVGKKAITVRSGYDGNGNPVFRKDIVTYKDIMLLALTKKQTAGVGDGLAQKGIPVKVIGGDITKRTGEFVSFHDLVRFLAHPEEAAYLCSVMSGSFFNLSDRELFIYRSLCGSFYINFDFKGFFEKSKLDEDSEEYKALCKAKECFEELKRFSGYMKRLSPAAAAERIIEELGIMGLHLTTGEKKAGLGSFISLIEKIRLKKITDVWGLALFISELSLMIENGFEEDVDIEGETYNAVRIMNAHKAKGLEAPIIILCAPYGGKAKSQIYYTEYDEQQEKYYGYAKLEEKYAHSGFKTGKYYAPAAWDSAEDKAKAKRDFERDRLIYVAATRAKNFLIIGEGSVTRSPSPWKKLIQSDTPDYLLEINSAKTDDATSVTGGNTNAAAVIKLSDAEAALSSIKSRRDAAFRESKETYKMLKPSASMSRSAAIADGSDAEESPQEESMIVTIGGDETTTKKARLQIGTVVHRLLEEVVKNIHKDEAVLSAAIDAIVFEHKDAGVTKEELEDVVKKFKEKGLYDKIKSAAAAYAEVPFSYKVSPGETYLGETHELGTYINGFIDLVFKDGDQWVIVDYKTHDDNEIDQKTRDKYKQQLEAYKEVWEKITGETNIKTDIFTIEKRAAG